MKEYLDAFADAIASIILLSLVVYVGAGLVDFMSASSSNVGMSWFGLYSFIVIMSATKLYGRGVYNTVRDLGLGLLNIDPPNNGRSDNKDN